MAARQLAGGAADRIASPHIDAVDSRPQREELARLKLERFQQVAWNGQGNGNSARGFRPDARNRERVETVGSGRHGGGRAAA